MLLSGTSLISVVVKNLITVNTLLNTQFFDVKALCMAKF
jgi:hypothetical protein